MLKYSLPNNHNNKNNNLRSFPELFSDIVGFQVLTSFVVWGKALCSLFRITRHFGGICRLYLQVRKISQARNHREAGSKQSYIPAWPGLTSILRPWRWTLYVSLNRLFISDSRASYPGRQNSSYIEKFTTLNLSAELLHFFRYWPKIALVLCKGINNTLARAAKLILTSIRALWFIVMEINTFSFCDIENHCLLQCDTV
jgi:hypothetical protein